MNISMKLPVSESSSGAELVLAHQYEPLDASTTRDLLRERGYELVCRFGHVHAAADAQEWHICLVGDLASMLPGHFLVCLEESIKQSLQLTNVR
jgi:hypothetical protein